MNNRNDEVLSRLQIELEKTNIIDFYIIRLDRSGKLLIGGSFDFCYYHEIEIYFEEVSFICCPTTIFSISSIRRAEEKEASNLLKSYNIDTNGTIMVLEDLDNNTCYYIIAGIIDFKFQIVKYYDNNGDTIRGEVMSDWANTKFLS